MTTTQDLIDEAYRRGLSDGREQAIDEFLSEYNEFVFNIQDAEDLYSRTIELAEHLKEQSK